MFNLEVPENFKITTNDVYDPQPRNQISEEPAPEAQINHQTASLEILLQKIKEIPNPVSKDQQSYILIDRAMLLLAKTRFNESKPLRPKTK